MRKIGGEKFIGILDFKRVIAICIAILTVITALPVVIKADENEVVSASALITMKFDFGDGAVEDGYIGVSASMRYNSTDKYGFTNPSAVENITTGESGALTADAVSVIPKSDGHAFNVDLPVGVYKITVMTGSDASSSIMAENHIQLFFMTGTNAVDSFVIPVTDGQLNIYPIDGKSDSTHSLSALVIEQISAGNTTKPTIWVAGDSTTASYYNVADDAMRGWGQYLGSYVDSDIYDVRNVSIDGIGAAELLACGPFDTAEYYGKSGDILIISVGLNDYIVASIENSNAPDSTGYVYYMTEMIRRAKNKGMKVYLVKQIGLESDISRYPLIKKRWFSDEIDTMAVTEGVEIIDLFTPWLVYCLENNHGGARDCYTEDGLHLNEMGAMKLAKMVKEQLFPEPKPTNPSQENYDAEFNTADTIVYQTEVYGGPVKNPHKGFVMTTYDPFMVDSTDGYEYGIGGVADNGAWDVVTICNGAIYWKDINPAMGRYNWDAIDNILEACWNHGMTYVIRILPYSHLVEEKDLVPDWVYEYGATKKTVTLVSDPDEELEVPDWGNDKYIEACKMLASALAEKYDGDPRVECIDIRPFGNWGEWHFSQVIGSEMPSIETQMDMIKYYADVFDETTIAITSDAYGEVYDYALELGVTKRNDGMIATPNEEWDLRKAYYAGLPAIAENAGTYKMMCANSDEPYGPLKWTPTRFRECIEIGHLSILALDQDSHCSYEFYQEQQEVIDEMCNRIGYNYTVTSAKRNGNKLLVTIKNTGVAPSYFNIELCAEITDSNGNKHGTFGNPVRIEKGSFMDETEQTFIFTYDGELDDNAYLCLAMYECDNKLLQGKDPSVRFDNKNNLPNNKLMLIEQNRQFLVEGYSLDIADGGFSLNIYTDIPNEYSNYTVQLELPDGTVTDTRVNAAKTVQTNGKTYQVFAANVAAKDISSRIKIRLYDTSGGMFGGVVMTSVEEYARALKKRDAKYSDFVDALLVYGYYAKAYFYGEDINGNSGKVYGSVDYTAIGNKITTGQGISTAGYIGSSLILESKVILRHYFNKRVSNSVYKNGVYYVEHTFNPTQFNQTYGGYNYSVNDYIKNVLCSDRDAKLKNLVSALYEYEIAAIGL